MSMGNPDLVPVKRSARIMRKVVEKRGRWWLRMALDSKICPFM